MKLLINTTTILSLALYVVPPFAAQNAAMAQDLQTVMVGDQQVICLPNKKTVCPEGAFCTVAIDPNNCQRNAEKAVAEAAAATDQAAADQAAAEKAAADQAAADQAAAEKAAADQAAADQMAAEKAAADQAAADQATAEKAAADQAAADQMAAEKAAADQAAADQATAEKAAADQAATDQAAAEKAAADQAAADQMAAEKAATDQAAADQVAAEKAAADQAAADQMAAEKAAADQAAADQAAAEKAAADATPAVPAEDTQVTNDAVALKTVTTADGTEVICLPNKNTACPDGAVCVVAVKTAKCMALAEKKVAAMSKPAIDQAATDQAAAEQAAADQAVAERAAAEQAAMDEANIAAAKAAEEAAAAVAAADPNLKPVEAPVVDEKATQTLETMLSDPISPNDGTSTDLPAPLAEAASGNTDLTAPPADLPPPIGSTVTTETVTAAETRASSQDFTAAPVVVAPGKKSGLSDLEKVGLLALGALVIGTMINNNKQQVVSNTGDRVVVKQEDGTYQVYKDDNSLLREPGSKVTTQTFKDGSTRSVVTRMDGSQIATIRDATGRVLQRVAYDTRGKATVLIDDLQPERRVDIASLPQPAPARVRISVDDGDAAMRAAMAAADAAELGQKFSLRQIRTIPQVRYLAPTIDVNNITFETGSAAIQPTEARKLNKLGSFIVQLIDDNPGEVFLIEGHTDAVGSAASNLALSDRRAESVAKALTEYFDVPPENLVVQGYGETELLVDSLGNERANRRVAVRIVTPLLQQQAAN